MSVTAVLGAVLCLFLTPIQSYIWNDVQTPGWLLTAQPLLDRVVGSAPIDPYEFFGRFFFLVYLAMLPVCIGVHGQHRHTAGRLERLGFWLTVGGLVVATVGDIGAYWGGLGQDASGFTQVQKTAYGVEGSGLLLILIGAVTLGIGTLKARVVSRWAAWLLTLAMPLGVPVALVVMYVPHGLVLPYSVTWSLIGWLRTVESIPPP
jgi:hypothetical protein